MLFPCELVSSYETGYFACRGRLRSDGRLQKPAQVNHPLNGSSTDETLGIQESRSRDLTTPPSQSYRNARNNGSNNIKH